MLLIQSNRCWAPRFFDDHKAIRCIRWLCRLCKMWGTTEQSRAKQTNKIYRRRNITEWVANICAASETTHGVPCIKKWHHVWLYSECNGAKSSEHFATSTFPTIAIRVRDARRVRSERCMSANICRVHTTHTRGFHVCIYRRLFCMLLLATSFSQQSTCVTVYVCLGPFTKSATPINWWADGSGTATCKRPRIFYYFFLSCRLLLFGSTTSCRCMLVVRQPWSNGMCPDRMNVRCNGKLVTRNSPIFFFSE